MKVNFQFLLSFFIALLMNGCSLHQSQPIEPPGTVPETFTEASGSAVDINFPEKWWTVFGDEKLNALVDEAFRHNLDLKTAFARLDQAETTLRSASASQMPHVNAEGQIARERSPSFLGDYTGNSYRLSLAAGYEVDVWKKFASLTSAAELEQGATLEDTKALYMSLSAQLVDTYYLAVEQRAQMNLTERTISSFEDTLKRVEYRYQEGIVPALDVYQARNNLAAARAIRPVLELNLAAAEHALATLLGRYPDKTTAINLAVIPDIPTMFSTGLPSDMIARRPDIQAAFLRLKASDERIASAIADRFPAFNLLGNYGKSSTAFVTGDVVGFFWNMVLSMVQPILDGGRRTAEVDRIKAVFRENLALYHKAVLTAFQEVEDALTANRTSEERKKLLKDQVVSYENALRLAEYTYFEGLSDYLPVLAAQQSLFESQRELLTARRQLVSDRVRLARALGGSWMDEYIEKHLAEKTGEGNAQ